MAVNRSISSALLVFFICKKLPVSVRQIDKFVNIHIIFHTDSKNSQPESPHMMMSQGTAHSTFDTMASPARIFIIPAPSSRKILFIVNRLKNARSVVVARIFQASPFGAAIIKRMPSAADIPNKPIVVRSNGFLSFVTAEKVVVSISFMIA